MCTNRAYIACVVSGPCGDLLAKIKEYSEQQVKLDPGLFLQSPGVPHFGLPHQIVPIPGQVVFLYSDLAGNFWRIIPTDGRPHRTDADASYFGDAVGHWEGDTLVVDTNNFNDDTWLGDSGLLHSDALHVVERLTRKATRSCTRLQSRTRRC
jgi:hypothetical protein